LASRHKLDRPGLTADSRLVTAMDCGRGSLIILHGLMRIKVLRSAPMTPVWEQHCQPPTKLSCGAAAAIVSLAGKMLSGQSIKTNKAASDATVEAHVVMSFACAGPD